MGEEERQMLVGDLLEAVKRCQARFGGRAELATESEPCVATLCCRLETALSHGLRLRPLSKANSTLRHVTEMVSSSLHLGRQGTQEQLVLWHFVREHLTRHEYERYTGLHNVTTDIGRGRAWLRAALNERSLERQLHTLLAAPQLLAAFYEDRALLLDQERSSTLPTMAAGLGSILFAISIDNFELDAGATSTDIEPVKPNFGRTEPLIMSTAVGDPGGRKKKEQRKRKRVQAQIVNFDDGPSECEGSEVERTPVESEEPWVQEEQAAEPEEVGVDVVVEPPSPSRPGQLPLAPSVGSGGVTGRQTLTPVNNVGVGELIPVGASADEPHSEEDSLSVPSYSEDTDCAAAALLATQKLLQSNLVDFSPHEASNATADCITQDNCHVNGEVRDALLTMLSLKEELQAEARSLRREAQQAQEQLAAQQRAHAERTERLEARVQALLRENELLKHQLRKYVGAVQMLKRDGSRAHEALASLEAQQPREHPADYHHEARQYESKLIQVAEMHGELMEFNERLQRSLQAKEAALRRLREELVELRGPLPDEHTSDDDATSVTSDYDAGSLGAAARALVNIWIPSAFLTGGSSDVHHVYQVFIRIRDDEWNIYRRYAQFYSLHKQLKKRDNIVSTFDFPPKKTLGNKDARFVEERRRRLQHYLRCVVNHLVQTNGELAATPDRELLVALVPFFGDSLAVPEDKVSGRRRNPFSRLARGERPAENSPQYTGL